MITTKKKDKELASIVEEEFLRQQNSIEMIASESIASLEIMELSGSVFTNKTLEGYIGNRFQAGHLVADKLEELTIKRAKELFDAEHVNIQPYSGTSANYGVYAAILKPNDKILAMQIDHGGHLTHGSSANFLSKMYDYYFYGVNPQTEMIDYDEILQKARTIKPKLIIAGASSYSRIIDYKKISEIASEIDAYFMVDMAHVSGLVASKVIPSPIPFADFVTTSTTKTFCGPRSGLIFCKQKHAKKLDYGVFPGSIGSLHLHTAAAKCFQLKYAATIEFKNLMKQVLINSKKLASELTKQGFRIVSGGTDNHLLVVDLTNMDVSGNEMQHALDYVGISVNKNLIPFDKKSAKITSGIRIGTTAITQRGFTEKEIVLIAKLIKEVATNYSNTQVLDKTKKSVQDLIKNFPLYT